MNANEIILAAAVSRLASLGEIQTRINPYVKSAYKSIEFYIEGVKHDNLPSHAQIGVEIVNALAEKIVFWIDGMESDADSWGETLNEIENFEG